MVVNGANSDEQGGRAEYPRHLPGGRGAVYQVALGRGQVTGRVGLGERLKAGGRVSGSTKRLLRNVIENRITKPTLMTAFGVRRTSPSGGRQVAAEVGDPNAIDPVLSRLMLEAMREAERDPALRERLGAMLADYRRPIVDAVRAGQQPHVARF